MNNEKIYPKLTPLLNNSLSELEIVDDGVTLKDDFQRILLQHPDIVPSFYIWISKVSLSPLEGLQTHPTAWMDHAEKFNKEFLLLLNDLLNLAKEAPDLFEEVIRLMTHTQSLKVISIVQRNYAKFSAHSTLAMVKFFQNVDSKLLDCLNPTLDSCDYIKELAHFDHELIEECLRSDTLDMLRSQYANPLHALAAIAFCSRNANISLWRPDEKIDMRSINLTHIARLNKHKEIREYIVSRGGFKDVVPWKQIPDEVWEINPSLPLDFHSLLHDLNLSNDVDMLPMLQQVVKDPYGKPCVVRIIEEYKLHKEQFMLNVDRNAFLSICRMCSSSDSIACEMFSLLFRNATEIFLTGTEWNQSFSALLAKLTLRYPSDQNPQTMEDRIRYLPQVWKSVVVRLIFQGFNFPNRLEPLCAWVLHHTDVEVVSRMMLIIPEIFRSTKVNWLKLFESYPQWIYKLNELKYYESRIVKDFMSVLERLADPNRIDYILQFARKETDFLLRSVLNLGLGKFSEFQDKEKAWGIPAGNLLFAEERNQIIQVFNPEIASILKQVSGRHFKLESYQVGNQLYLDMYLLNPLHKGLNKLFIPKNISTIRLLNSVESQKLTNKDRFYDHVLALVDMQGVNVLAVILNEMLTTNDYQFGESLLDQCKAGYIPEVELMDDTGHRLNSKCRANAGSIHAHTIQKILKSKKTITLDDQLIGILSKEPNQKGFSYIQEALANILEEDSKQPLVNVVTNIMCTPVANWTPQEQKIVYCCEHQAYHLAEIFAFNAKGPWELFAKQLMDTQIIIPMSYLLLDCIAAGREMEWQQFLDLDAKGTPTKEMLDYIAKGQYLLAHQNEDVSLFSDKTLRELVLLKFQNSLEHLDKQIYANESEKQSVMETARSLKLAELLVTKSGNLNIGIILDITIESSSSEAEIYLEATVRALAKMQDISFLLSNIQLPLDLSSQMKLILRKMFNLPDTVPLTHWHAQVAALSAILRLPRQIPNIGSCFGTCWLIILQSDSQNIRQSLLDYSLMIKDGYLQKSGKKFFVEPSLLSLDDTKLKENLLLRARENLLTNMAESDSLKLLNQNLNLFSEQGFFAKNLKYILEDKFAVTTPLDTRVFLTEFRKHFQTFARAVVQFNESHPITGEFGSWILMRNDRNEVIDQTNYFDFLVEVITKAGIDLKLQYPYFVPLIEVVISDLAFFLNTWFRSSQNRKLAAAKLRKDNKEILNYALWVTPGGGVSVKVALTYFQYKGAKIPEVSINSKHTEALLMSLINCCDALPEKIKATVLAEPEKMLYMHIPSHSLGLKPFAIIQHLHNRLSKRDIFHSLKPSTSLKMDLIPKDKRLEMFNKWLSGMPAHSHEQFKEAFSLKPWESMTLEECGKEIAETFRKIYGMPLLDNVVEKLENAFFDALPSEIKQKLSFLIIGDLNYLDDYRYLGFAYSYIKGEIACFNLSRNGEKRRMNTSDQTGDWILLQPLSRFENGSMSHMLDFSQRGLK